MSKEIKSKEEVLERIENFILKVKGLKEYEESLNKIKGFLIIGGSSLLILDENAFATSDIDSYVVMKDKIIDWFHTYMVEPAQEEDINDQAAKQLTTLTKLIMLDKEYILIDNLYGFDIFTPSIETLILTKVNAIAERNKDKDKSDLEILLSKEYDLSKLKALSLEWVELIKNKTGSFESMNFLSTFKKLVEQNSK